MDSRSARPPAPAKFDVTVPPDLLSFDADGHPRSTLYDDVYKSRAGAFAEAVGVFVDGARLPERWRRAPRFTVLELGFGLGVNFLAALRTWRGDPDRSGRLHFVSLEGHLLAARELARAHEALAVEGDDARRLRERWPLPTPGLHRIAFEGGRVTLTVAIGDVDTLLPRLAVAADAFFLDGFAPDRNPAMWAATNMRRLARIAAPGATLATYSTAARVRDALHAAGFSTRVLPGVGSKRHRLAGVYDPQWPTYPPPEAAPHWPGREAIVVGAGLAGCANAAALASRGWRVRLLERCGAHATEGSAQHAVADHLHVSPDDNLLARLTRAALFLARQDRDAPDSACGKLVVAEGPEESERQFATAARLAYPEGFLRALDRREASDVAGVALRGGALWLPMCRSADPSSLCAAWLARATGAAELNLNASVARIERADGQWRLFDDGGRELGRAPVVVLANAGDAWRLAGGAAGAAGSLRRVRGQTTLMDGSLLRGLRTVLGGDAYACPLPDGRVLAGATFDDGDSLAAEPAADLSNLRRLARMLELSSPADEWADRAVGGCTSGRTGFRFVARDRLPLVGPMPDAALIGRRAGELMRNARLPMPVLPGLYGSFGYGSRGLLWSTLGAEVLAAAIEGEPAPIEADLLGAIEPARFLRQDLRRGRRPAALR